MGKPSFQQILGKKLACIAPSLRMGFKIGAFWGYTIGKEARATDGPKVIPGKSIKEILQELREKRVQG